MKQKMRWLPDGPPGAHRDRYVSGDGRFVVSWSKESYPPWTLLDTKTGKERPFQTAELAKTAARNLLRVTPSES